MSGSASAVADDYDAPPFTTKTFTGRPPADPDFSPGGTAGADDEGEALNSGKPGGQREEGFPAGAKPPEPPPPPLRIFSPTIFAGRTPPPREWVVPHWIPYHVVTGCYGDGGIGKSLIMQQLQTGTALGSSWIGLPVEEVISLGIYCEDDEDELWRRQCSINVTYSADHGDLDRMHCVSRLGEDNILMTFGHNGVGEFTIFHHQVLEASLDLKARLVIIDAAADTFGGNENDRGQVRQFVQRALGQIAIKTRGAVVCNAHPSRAGMSSGTGDSGSTGWSNAFRSRTYLQGVEDDDLARIIDRKKANYAARNDRIRLRWREGVLVPDEPQRGLGGIPIDARAVFLDLIREMQLQGRPVSSAIQAQNYAPRVFATLPPDQRRNFDKKAFENAMNVLLRDRKIINKNYGRKGDLRTQIGFEDDPETEDQKCDRFFLPTSCGGGG